MANVILTNLQDDYVTTLRITHLLDKKDAIRQADTTWSIQRLIAKEY